MAQGDFAEKMKVPRQSISKWETGTSIPELDKLFVMSQLFQISLDELVKENDCAYAPTFLDPIDGVSTRTFYGSTVDATTQIVIGGETYWEGASFSLIEM